MALPRLRQAVVAAVDFAATSAALEAALGVRDPFHDDGIVHFGLRNAVYAVGDTFVEIVSPVRDGTAAGRQIQRAGGDCGYMCMFEVADIVATRARLAETGARIVHDTTHPDIVDLHLHPKDVPGAIVALDVTQPVGSWRWGGPAWEAAVPAHDAGGLTALTVAVHDPGAGAARWSAVLGVDADSGCLHLDGGRQQVRFIAAADDEVERIVEVRTATRGGPAASLTATAEAPVVVGGVRFVRETIDTRETA